MVPATTATICVVFMDGQLRNPMLIKKVNVRMICSNVKKKGFAKLLLLKGFNALLLSTITVWDGLDDPSGLGWGNGHSHCPAAGMGEPPTGPHG